MYKGDQLKWQSARFAFERHRDRYPDSPISFSLQLFSLPIATQVFCAKQQRLENRTNMQGGLAQVVERSIRIRYAPGWRPGYSNWLFFTIIFIANFNASFLCQTEKVGEQKTCTRGISSSGRALDSHSRGTGIDTRILQLVFLYNYFRCQLQHKFLCQTAKVGEQNKYARGISSSGRALDSHSIRTGMETRILQLVILYNNFHCQSQRKFFVRNRKGWRIEKMSKGDQLKWQSARFAFERHRDRYPDSPISFSLQLFSLPIATQVCCAKQKRLENRKNVQGGLAQVVERSIRIREAPGSIPGFSNQFFFTIIFVANCNTSILCQTEKVGEQNKYARGISSSGRALDSHSIGTGMETRILQLVILYNNFHCQFQRKFFVPNRKGWRIEKMFKGDQLKWQSARFAFERHRDRYPDSPISFSLQLFSLPIATQVFCAKQKRLENRTNMQGGLAQVVERSIRIRQAPGWRPGYSNWLFFTIIFVANCNTSFLCKTEKVGEQNKYARGISSSGRALDSHSIRTGMETRILQLVILYNNFHCQFQRKFFVPNRKGWRIENMYKGDQLKWQSARFAFERHRDRYPDSPISFSLQLFSLPIATQVFVPNSKGWRIEQICKGDQLKWQSARFAFDTHRDGDPDTPIGYSLQ